MFYPRSDGEFEYWGGIEYSLYTVDIKLIFSWMIWDVLSLFVIVHYYTLYYDGSKVGGIISSDASHQAGLQTPFVINIFADHVSSSVCNRCVILC